LGILERHSEESARPALEDVQEEMRLMSGLVEELLSFSRAGMEKNDELWTGRCGRDRASGCGAGSGEAPRGVHVAIGEPLMVVADREYLLRVLSNLVRNAIRMQDPPDQLPLRDAVNTGKSSLV